jgi:photosystem II stability/assembly factor-like uncharacterized protein
MKMWQRRGGVLLCAAALAISAAALRVSARSGEAQGTSPSRMSGLFYRPLTAFSRGGRVTAVAGVTSDTQVYYMGSAGGVFKTTDAGVTWMPVTDGQINVGSIGAIAVAESDPNIVYVGTGTGDPRGNVSNGDGVYRSSDAGKTWRHVGLEKAGIIGRIRVNPTNPDIAFVGVIGNIFGPNSERGVYRTKDGGRTWEQVLKISENTGANDITMDPKNPNILIAAMWTVRRQPWSIDTGGKDDGLFKTTDGGDHWTKLAGGLPTARMGKIGVSMCAANPKKVYALIEADASQGGVFVSDNEGDSWTRVYDKRNLQQRAYYYTHIFADPVDENTVFANNTSAFKSTDGGKTWSGQRAGHGDNHDWWINPKNNKAMIESNDGGANISLDGGQTWSTENNQPTAEIYRIAVDTRWPYWVYGAQQDNSSVAVPSNNVGAPNLNAGPGEAGYLAVDPRNYGVVYAGNYGGTLQRADSVTGLNENVRVYADEETGQQAVDLKYRFQWNAPIRLSPSNPDVVYTTSQYVHRSKDHGQNWERISPDLTRNDKVKQGSNGVAGITKDMTGVEVYDTIFSFEESPATPGVLWAGSDDGLLHISKDNGKTWDKITPTGLPEWSTINAIDLSEKNAAHAIVTAYKFNQNDYTPYVYETNDYGKTWRRLADGTNGIPAGHATRVVREDRDMPGLLVAGTEYGMYISYDDGAHWAAFQLNLPRVPIMDLKFYRHNLIVATEGRAFWILDDVPVIEGMKEMSDSQPAFLFKPAEGYRTGGGGGRGGGGGGGATIPPPTFEYWFKDEPTAPVTLQVLDPSGAAVYTATGQPGTGTEAQPPAVIPDAGMVAAAGGGRGGGGAPGAGAGGRAAGGGVPAGAAGGAAGAAAQAGGGGGRGAGGRGAGGFGGGAPASVSAHKGLNVATWTQFTLPSLFSVPPGLVMWGGGGGQGPRVAPGMYTVKVSMGSWSQSRTFHLAGDPRYQPPITDAEGAQTLKMALEVGGWNKAFFDSLLKIRDAKKQAADLASKTPALDPSAKAFTASAVKVEGDMTQLQGDPTAGQDGLSFSGRLDNQLLTLYSNINGTERKLGTAVLERYADLKPQYDQLMARAAAVLKADVETFNAAAAKAGVTPGIVIK